MSVHKIQGTIKSTSTKTITVKNGARAGSDATVHYINIDGYNVNVGFNNPYTEGERVTLNVEHKFGEWKVSKAPHTAEGWPAVTPSTGSSKGGAKESFPTDKTSHTMSIIRQNSMGHAAKIVGDWFQTREYAPEKVTLGEYYEMVLDVAYRITDFSSGHLELKRVEEMRESLRNEH